MGRVRALLGWFPVTATGFVALFASLMALVPFGIWRSDRVLIVGGVVGILLLILAHGLTFLGALVVRRAVRQQPELALDLVVGHPKPTGFRLTLPWWLPLLDAHWTTLAPQVRTRLVQRGRTTEETWIATRRGTPTTVRRAFQIGDAFGLCAIRFEASAERAMRFLPDEGSLRRVEVVQGLASGDHIAHPDGRPEGDLQDMRQYGAGDPIRYVLWKVFAKSRTLVVRTPERALSPITRTAAYLVTGPHDEAAAGTAKTAVECGALGAEWVFGCDGTTRTARARQEVLPLLVLSANTPPADAGKGLRSFLEAADKPRRIVVFAPACKGPWVAQVLALAGHTGVELVLCADRIVAPSRRFDPKRLLLYPIDDARPGEVLVPRNELIALVESLKDLGNIRLVERQPGTVYAGAHIARLLQRGAA